MKFFLTEAERKETKSTCYHEFYKGKWDQDKMVFWHKDSMNIHDDIMQKLKLDELIFSVVDGYDPYGETEVTKAQWNDIKAKAEETGGDLLDAIHEITPWVEDNYATQDVFTILGI